MEDGNDLGMEPLAGESCEAKRTFTQVRQGGVPLPSPRVEVSWGAQDGQHPQGSHPASGRPSAVPSPVPIGTGARATPTPPPQHSTSGGIAGSVAPAGLPFGRSSFGFEPPTPGGYGGLHNVGVVLPNIPTLPPTLLPMPGQHAPSPHSPLIAPDPTPFLARAYQAHMAMQHQRGSGPFTPSVASSTYSPLLSPNSVPSPSLTPVRADVAMQASIPFPHADPTDNGGKQKDGYIYSRTADGRLWRAVPEKPGPGWEEVVRPSC